MSSVKIIRNIVATPFIFLGVCLILLGLILAGRITEARSFWKYAF